MKKEFELEHWMHCNTCRQVLKTNTNDWYRLQRVASYTKNRISIRKGTYSYYYCSAECMSAHVRNNIVIGKCILCNKVKTKLFWYNKYKVRCCKSCKWGKEGGI